VEDAVSVVLDVHCQPCGRPDRPGPRLARFSREEPGGPIVLVRHRLVTSGEQWYVYDTRAPEPYCHTRRDGGRTWYLGCGCGHTPRVPEERVAAAMDIPGAGNTRRVSL
jgi:hypothetical protein